MRIFVHYDNFNWFFIAFYEIVTKIAAVYSGVTDAFYEGSFGIHQNTDGTLSSAGT